jgi:hypothetical protein
MKTLFRSTLLLSVLSLALPGLVLADAKKDAKAATASGPIDLNNATQSQLESLNGVGPATAKKIIAGRPYTSVSDLSKAGVSAATITKITPMVTVGKAAPAPAPAPAPAAKTVAPTPAPAPAPAATTTTAKTTPKQPTAANTSACAANMVWANTDSKVYHTSGDRWFGNTKKGQCMTEADAQKAGYRAAKEGAAKKKTS